MCGQDLCRALAAVHATGLVHRDVKTANVMRESGGRLVLMDFGAGQARDIAATGPSQLVGTPLCIAPEVLAADNTPAAIDLLDYGAATLLLHIGVGGITFSGSNKIEFVLTHSDDNSTYANVTDDDVIKDSLAPATITSGIVRSLVAAHAAATIQKLGYVGGKRYLKLLADFSGTHGTGTPIGATVAKGLGAIRGTA